MACLCGSASAMRLRVSYFSVDHECSELGWGLDNKLSVKMLCDVWIDLTEVNLCLFLNLCFDSPTDTKKQALCENAS